MVNVELWINNKQEGHCASAIISCITSNFSQTISCPISNSQFTNCASDLFASFTSNTINVDKITIRGDSGALVDNYTTIMGNSINTYLGESSTVVEIQTCCNELQYYI